MMNYSPSYLVVVLLLLFVSANIFVEGKILRFREDGTFKITQFTDMHYGEDPFFDDGSKLVQGINLNKK